MQRSCDLGFVLSSAILVSTSEKTQLRPAASKGNSEAPKDNICGSAWDILNSHSLIMSGMQSVSCATAEPLEAGEEQWCGESPALGPL